MPRIRTKHVPPSLPGDDLAYFYVRESLKAGAIILAAALIPVAVAQAQPLDFDSDDPTPADVAPVETDPNDPDDSFLGGPDIDDSERPSLIRHGLDGEMQDVRGQARPELRALDMLELAPAEDARVQALLNERAAIIESILNDHGTQIFQLQQAMQGAGDDRAARREAAQEIQTIIKPLLDEPELQSTLASAMSAGNADTFNHMMDEWYGAKASDRIRRWQEQQGERAMGSAAPAISDERIARVKGRMQGELAMQEVGQALRGQLEIAKATSDELLLKLNLTPEQSRVIEPLYRKTRENMLAARTMRENGVSNRDPEFRAIHKENRELIMQIAGELDDAQRDTLREELGNRGRFLDRMNADGQRRGMGRGGNGDA